MSAPLDGLTVRTATEADLPAMYVADGRGFGFQYTEQDLEDLPLIVEPERFLVATVANEVVGVAGAYDMQVTPPGGEPLPTAGVTWVSVSMLHRRRGVLRALMAEQLRGLRAAGLPLAMLNASEATIYGRFGYGVVSTAHAVEIDTAAARFAADAPDPGGVRWADPAQVREHAPQIHDRWRRGHPGAVTRAPSWWDYVLLDREHRRHGWSAAFHLLHDDGYAAFRTRGDRVEVRDFFAVTPDAHAALWRALLGRDLVKVVETTVLAGDDPLHLLLADRRALRTTQIHDDLWVRLLDVPAALAARRWSAPVDVVLEVDDPFLGAGGRFRLHGGPGGARCTPTDEPADVALGIDRLASVVFGTRATTLARAGLVTGDPAALAALDLAALTDRDPRAGIGF